jgi:hypothetical protein
MENCKNLDKRKEGLTIARLRTYPGLENVTDEEAEHIINSLNELANLLCLAVQRKKQKMRTCIDNQQDMSIFANRKAA